MTKSLTIPASSSALVNILLLVVTDPEMLWDTAARAAELIALDLRVDQWCIEIGKVTASREVETAWTDYLKSPEHDHEDLRDCIEHACNVFGAIVADGGRDAEDDPVNLHD
jgi:hypothetical protein